MQGPRQHIQRQFASRRLAGVLLAGLCSAILFCPPAAAATIDIQTTNIDGDPVSFITVEGQLEPGDEARFADLAIGLPAGAVLFSSPGGDLNAGIDIGKAIRLKGFVTMAAEPYGCASACALAWLGGSRRFMAVDFAVGFHAVYLAADPSRRADSVGNALVGAYLNQLGLTPQAITYITEAQPQGMKWLSFEDARAVGIEVVALDPTDETAEPADPGPPQAADDWASYGEWIQIYSRQSFAEAVDLAGAFRREFPGTFVFRYDNGWYVGAIGPYPFGRARPERDRLIRLGRIPTDSLVNRGDSFVDLVWGASPERPSTASRPSDEDFALGAAEEFFNATSQSRGEVLVYLGRVYPSQVDYYGTRTSKPDVMLEKDTFLLRWPERSYILRDGASVACRADGSCVVDGLVDWRNYSAPRKATSTGTARFTLTFARRGGAVTLLGESSTVLERNVRQR